MRWLMLLSLIAGCKAKEHSHHEMPHRFEDAERWAKIFDDPARDAWQKPAELIALLELQPGAKVADLGAGTGYFLPYLSKAVGPDGVVLGLDVEGDMVRYMKERAKREGLSNVEARHVAADDPALAAASIDRILILDTWHHIQDRVEYLRKLDRALAEGGQIFVVDFTLESEKGPPKKHRLEPAAVIAEMRQANLQGEVISESLPDHYVIRARK